MKRIILIRNAADYDFGGGERFPVFVSTVLRQHSLHPIILSRHRRTLRFAKQNGIPTIRGWWWSRQNWSNWRALFFPVYTLWQIILTCYYFVIFYYYKPSTVHIQSKDDFIAATIAGRLRGATIVWTDHADLKHVWKNIAVWYKNPVGKLVYSAAKLAHQITLVSESEKREVSALLPVSSPVHNKLSVIYNGCADVYDGYPPQKHSTFTFVMAGRLVTDKGVGEAIVAFKEIHSQHPDTRLIIAGDGPERIRFEAQAKDTSSIRFLGHQSDPYAAMRQGDVFLQPTYHEGFSVALVEASMLGMPIIATNVGGNVEIIHDGENGLLVPAHNYEALYQAMLRLYADSGLRKSLAKQARQTYLDNFIFDSIVSEKFIPLYEGSYEDKD